MKSSNNFKLAYSFIVLTLVTILLINGVNAVETLGTFKQSDLVILKTSCSNSTYANITYVSFPNSSFAILGNYPMTKSGNDYYISYDNISSSLGQWIYCYRCNLNGNDGNYCSDYYVTTTGDKVSLSNIIIVISFLIVAGILFSIGITFDQKKWIIKSGFFLCALLMAIIAMNSARLIASESLGLSSMANAGFILLISVVSLMFLYIMVLWTIETFKSVKEKRGVRWNY